MIEPGAPAPNFTLPNHRGEPVSLADLRGSKVVLCFYPNDFSPVCSDQLSAYQPHLEEFTTAGAELIGISTDGSWAHNAFRKHLGLEMTLLSDFHPKGEVSRLYGAYLEEWGTPNRSRRPDRRGRDRALGARRGDAGDVPAGRAGSSRRSASSSPGP